MQCEILSAAEFQNNNRPNSTFYVGFLQAQNGTWFPFCVSSSNENAQLDTICVSPNYAWLDEVMRPFLARLPSVKNHLVHLVYREEIDNIMSMYGIKYVGYVVAEGESRCDCGCGCH